MHVVECCWVLASSSNSLSFSLSLSLSLERKLGWVKCTTMKFPRILLSIKLEKVQHCHCISVRWYTQTSKHCLHCKGSYEAVVNDDGKRKMQWLL